MAETIGTADVCDGRGSVALGLGEVQKMTDVLMFKAQWRVGSNRGGWNR